MKNKDYLDLVEFWNNSFALSEEDKREFANINPEEDYKGLAPSQKQFDALVALSKQENILDYGCGTGWASIIMAKNGAKKITAVDVASNSIEMLDCYAKAFKVEDIIKGIAIDENWLGSQKEETFDGLFCSNVIDVVPLEMAKDIVKNSERVVKKDARVIFSLNFYADPEAMKARGAEINGPHVYINGVLRLTSLKDEEWLDIFKEFYEVEEVIYYAWPGEPKETRRLFILKK